VQSVNTLAKLVDW